MKTAKWMIFLAAWMVLGLQVNLAQIQSIPYFDDFEGGIFWYTSANAVNWQLGAPSGAIINTAYSPVKAWVTNPSGHYSNTADEHLYTPLFDFTGLSGMDTVTLSFYHAMAAEPGDYGRVQYSVNGGQTWANLGFFADPGGTNWYNTTSGGLHYFNYLNSGWMQSAYKLFPNTFNGQPQVQFRFHFYSNQTGTSEGWAIDNFSLTMPLPNTVPVTNIIFPQNDTLAGTQIYPQVIIRNMTNLTLNTIPLELTVATTTIHTVNEVWTGSLPSLDTLIYTFTTPYTVPPGVHQLCIKTMVPGTWPFGVHFCRHLNGLSPPPNTGYLYGMLSTPTGAAGQSQVYLILHDSVAGTLTAIDTVPTLDTAGVTSYSFSNLTPGNYLVKAAMNPGNPGYANNIPSYHQSALYWNQATPVQIQAGVITQASISFVQGINPGGPGFIGGSIVMGANKSSETPLPNVRIVLLDHGNEFKPIAWTRSNGDGLFSFQNIPLGTYTVYAEVLNMHTFPPTVTIDSLNPVAQNVKLVVNTNVSYITDEIPPLSDGIGWIFPNPTGAEAFLPVKLTTHNELTIKITTLTGQTLQLSSHSLPPGMHNINLKNENYSPGIYLVTATLPDGSGITRKMVIK
jgi:hypothetical protein